MIASVSYPFLTTVKNITTDIGFNMALSTFNEYHCKRYHICTVTTPHHHNGYFLHNKELCLVGSCCLSLYLCLCVCVCACMCV